MRRKTLGYELIILGMMIFYHCMGEETRRLIAVVLAVVFFLLARESRKDYGDSFLTMFEVVLSVLWTVKAITG